METEQKHDFYSRLYKQYTVDLLRLAIFARSLLTNSRVREYLDQHHPMIVARFESSSQTRKDSSWRNGRANRSSETYFGESRQGLPLATAAEQRGENALYQAGARIFGSWPNAVMAAGISPNRARSITDGLPKRFCIGHPFVIATATPSAPRRTKRDDTANLWSRTAGIFGSWSKAVIAAGVDPLKLRRAVPWTTERIIEAILKLALNNEPWSGGPCNQDRWRAPVKKYSARGKRHWWPLGSIRNNMFIRSVISPP